MSDLSAIAVHRPCATVRLHARSMSRLPSISPIASTLAVDVSEFFQVCCHRRSNVRLTKVSPIEVTRIPATVDRCEVYQVCDPPCAKVYRLNGFFSRILLFCPSHVQSAHEKGYRVQPGSSFLVAIREEPTQVLNASP